MRDAYSLGSVEETQKALGQIMTDLFNGMGTVLDGASQAARDWDAQAKEQGWDVSKLAEQTGRQGAKGIAASMTQDQATGMNGFLNNGLIFWRDISEHTKLIYAFLAGGGTNSRQLLNSHAQNMLKHLSSIDGNTEYCRRLEGIESNISNISAGIDEIKTRGILLKKS
ncbi:MAG: hypothetical protein LBP50_05105 [Tannerella sp.]|nr:hypothetical protein [Tannerella sp.]